MCLLEYTVKYWLCWSSKPSAIAMVLGDSQLQGELGGKQRDSRLVVLGDFMLNGGQKAWPWAVLNILWRGEGLGGL